MSPTHWMLDVSCKRPISSNHLCFQSPSKSCTSNKAYVLETSWGHYHQSLGKKHCAYKSWAYSGSLVSWANRLAKVEAGPVGSLYQDVRVQIDTSHNDHQLENGHVSKILLESVGHMCQGLNSHYFHIIGDGHQPNCRGLYTQYKDSLLKVG